VTPEPERAESEARHDRLDQRFGLRVGEAGTAVDHEVLTGDVRRGVGAEERDDAGDFVGAALSVLIFTAPMNTSSSPPSPDAPN